MTRNKERRFNTHKSTAQGKAQTIERRQIRSAKYAQVHA
jgi:hypothetical protein